MESTSIKNMIQVTADTAALLREKGKGHTLIPREGLVKAKGKGYMQTFWLRPQTSPSTTSSYSLDVPCQHEADHIHSRALHDEARAELGLPSFSHQQTNVTKNSSPSVPHGLPMHQELDHSWNDTGFVNSVRGQEGLRRLIKWNTAVLESILLNVVIQRKEQRRKSGTGLFKSSKWTSVKHDNFDLLFHEEIKDEVDMPRFNREVMSQANVPTKDTVKLIPADARSELRAYVARIASMYRDVHFHNFEHAGKVKRGVFVLYLCLAFNLILIRVLAFSHTTAHVTMSAQKLINKVVLRNSPEFGGMSSAKKSDGEKRTREEADLFFSTYGISADPLAQFAVVFAALVHDVDHTGKIGCVAFKNSSTRYLI